MVFLCEGFILARGESVEGEGEGLIGLDLFSGPKEESIVNKKKRKEYLINSFAELYQQPPS